MEFFLNEFETPVLKYGSFVYSTLGMHIDSMAFIYMSKGVNVFGYQNYKIIKLNSQGELVQTFQDEGELRSRLNYPYGIAVDNQNRIVTSISQADHIVLFEQKNYISKIKIKPQNEGLVSVLLRENTVSNENGENNVTSNQLDIHYDTIAPTIGIDYTQGETSGEYPFVINLHSNEFLSAISKELIADPDDFRDLVITGDGLHFQIEFWPAGNNIYNISLPWGSVTVLANLKGGLL